MDQKHLRVRPHIVHIFCRISKRHLFFALLFIAIVLCISYSFSRCIVIDLSFGLYSGNKKSYSPFQLQTALRNDCLRQSTGIVFNSQWPTLPVTSGKNGNIKDGEIKTKERYEYRYFQQQGLVMVKRLPKALIIGVKKGGTRALLEFVRVHPDVRAVGSEVHFFDHHYGKGLEWYRQQMPITLDGQITMEKTPSYFVTKDVPRRVYHMNPTTRLLVVVRDPVTRAISDYAQAASKRNDIKGFEELAFLNTSTGLVNTSWGPIRIGVYARHLERWLKYFPLAQFHFVSGEGLVSDPAAEMAKVQDFLGLKRVITDKHFYFNATKGFPCLMKSEVSALPRCLGRSKGREHPAIDPKAIERLRDFYRPFNAKFYYMTNTDFGWP